MPIDTHTELMPPERPLFAEIRLAVAGFLARYSDPTRTGYTHDLKSYFGWCEHHHLGVFEVRRGHMELWARTMEDAGLARATIGRRLSTVAGFYRFAVIDGLIEHSPAEYVRRPKIDTESTTLGLDRMELGALIAQGAAAGPMDHALACLLGLLGLRVGGLQHQHRSGLRRAGAPHRDRAREGVEACRHPVTTPGRSCHGPCHRPPAPRPAPAHPGREPHEPPRCHAHRPPARAPGGRDEADQPASLRHSFITAALDAGVPPRDVQTAARHADPRTTTRYDRARDNLDRHASYIVTAFVAGAS